MSESGSSYDVRIYSIDVRQGTRQAKHRVRWSVGEKRFSKVFATAKLADSFRSVLMQAASRGEAFDLATGRPMSEVTAARADRLWVQLAREFIDERWDEFAARHRQSTVDGLVTLTCGLLHEGRQPPDLTALRSALTHWEFNTGARRRQADPPVEYRDALRWIAANSLPLEKVAEHDGIRGAIKAISTTLDGSRASASTFARKRAALSGPLRYAVEKGYLSHSPLRDVRVKRQQTVEAIDPRVVVNPQQAKALLDAVREIEPTVHGFFALLYYAALRPAEARAIRKGDLTLPESGWGQIVLHGSYQESGAAWTDAGTRGEERHLKHRADRDTRVIPAHPDLVKALRTHLATYELGVGGRLFVTRAGRGGHPIPAPWQNPVSMSTIYRVWARAREQALTPEQAESPLARRPYDLRHAAVSTWLSAGVDSTQVAAWAGHSVAVLMRAYASSLHGHQVQAMRQIEAFLGPDENS
ncbi:tyrosine-type recombinase/integrase [Nocardioides sp. CER19]|uniref:tyrosine-type recombinase/integrase n=1 Tax=Nocardioides sp. CER19 TaxID=3038538 RepID=UPI00244C2AE4|nr:tyrosine-type recombinase/integrase [Nocardioides sp. CER19]MDH2414326.1 tyrosine-type recombinase/integrase [Nocardioides sp. CER19]